MVPVPIKECTPFRIPKLGNLVPYSILIYVYLFDRSYMFKWEPGRYALRSYCRALLVTLCLIDYEVKCCCSYVLSRILSL